MGSDDCDQSITNTDRLLNYLHKVEAKLDRVDIHEDLALTEAAF